MASSSSHDSYSDLFGHAVEIQDPTPTGMKDPENLFSGEDKSKVLLFLFKLVKTPPSIFGKCMELTDGGGRFIFHPFDAEANANEERVDILLWTCAYAYAGKAWELPGWASSETKVQYKEPDDDAIFSTVTIEGKTLKVTQRAKKSLEASLEAMSTQPNEFFKCLAQHRSICLILGVDELEYGMPQTLNELQDFDWDKVDPKDMKTWPQPPKQTAFEAEVCRSVYNNIKELKDLAARNNERFKSGIPTYTSAQGKGRRWKQMLAHYRTMSPEKPLQGIVDVIKFKLKLTKSLDGIHKIMEHDLVVHLLKLKHEEKKRQKAAEDTEEKKAERAALQKKIDDAAEKEKQDIQAAADKQVEIAQKEAEKEAVNAGQQRGKRRATSQCNKELQALEVENEEAAAEVKRSKEARARLESEVIPVDDSGSEAELPTLMLVKSTKKAKKNWSHLETDVAPRQLVLLQGSEWKPPARVCEGRAILYVEPGADWADSNRQKISKLLRLQSCLQSEGLLPPTLTFALVMDTMGVGDNYPFPAKAFILLIALILEDNGR